MKKPFEILLSIDRELIATMHSPKSFVRVEMRKLLDRQLDKVTTKELIGD